MGADQLSEFMTSIWGILILAGLLMLYGLYKLIEWIKNKIKNKNKKIKK